MGLRSRLVRLPLAEIHITERRTTWRSERRCDGKGVAELLRHVRAQGWLQAVTVRPMASGGYELIDGERRIVAAELAGETAIDAMVLDVDNASATAIALLANLGSKRLTGIEMARLCAQIGTALSAQSGRKATQKEIGAWVGLKQPTVSQYMAIADAFDAESLDTALVSFDELVPVSAAELEEVAKLPEDERHDWLVALSNGNRYRPGDDSAATTDTSEPAQEISGRLEGVHEILVDTGVDLDAQVALAAITASLRIAVLLAVQFVARAGAKSRKVLLQAWARAQEYRSPIFEGLRTRRLVMCWWARSRVAAAWRILQTSLAYTGVSREATEPEDTQGDVRPPPPHRLSSGRTSPEDNADGKATGIPPP